MSTHESITARPALAALASFLVISTAFLFAQKQPAAATLAPMAPALEARATKLHNMASPQLRSWIQEEAQRIKGTNQLDVEAIGTAANARFGGKTPLSVEQRDLVALLVLHQVAKLDQEEYQAKSANTNLKIAKNANVAQPNGSSKTATTSAAKASNAGVKGQLDIRGKDLEAQDKLGNFEIQGLMSQYNEAQTLASSIMKKRDDASNAVIQKI